MLFQALYSSTTCKKDFVADDISFFSIFVYLKFKYTLRGQIQITLHCIKGERRSMYEKKLLILKQSITHVHLIAKFQSSSSMQMCLFYKYDKRINIIIVCAVYITCAPSHTTTYILYLDFFYSTVHVNMRLGSLVLPSQSTTLYHC